jgi:hypothetical protein
VKLLIPPSFTDLGVIERVRIDGPRSVRETWDPVVKAWSPAGNLTNSLLHGRELSPTELVAAGIPRED